MVGDPAEDDDLGTIAFCTSGRAGLDNPAAG